jgi:PAS domain-containing protein
MLRESQIRLSMAQEIAHMGNWEWHLDTGKVVWSDEVYRLFGFQPREIQPTFESFLDLILPADSSTVLDLSFVYVQWR